MICSRNTPFWLETLEIGIKKYKRSEKKERRNHKARTAEALSLLVHFIVCFFFLRNSK